MSHVHSGVHDDTQVIQRAAEGPEQTARSRVQRGLSLCKEVLGDVMTYLTRENHSYLRPYHWFWTSRKRVTQIGGITPLKTRGLLTPGSVIGSSEQRLGRSRTDSGVVQVAFAGGSSRARPDYVDQCRPSTSSWERLGIYPRRDIREIDDCIE